MSHVCTGGPGPRAPRPLPRWRQVLLGMATAAWRVITCQRALAAAPGLTGQPPYHPESMTRRLPRRHERWLAAIDRQEWPDGACGDMTRRPGGTP
jgi:hypothetical protein